MKRASKKKINIEDLATTIDNLAIMTQNGFSSFERRFDKVDERFSRVEECLGNIESGQRRMNQDILNLGEKYITRREFDGWAMRVINLEKKKSKSK